MNILYGIQGLGNGHLSRARVLVPELRKAGHNIDFIFSGRDRKSYFDMDVFGKDCRYFEGLSIDYCHGKVNPVKTVLKNNHIKFFAQAFSLDVSNYDLILSDYEPITAWASMKHQHKLVSFSNQMAFNYDVPKLRGYLASKIIMKILLPCVHRVGLHWHHFDQAILPPILPNLKLCEGIDKNILVYMYVEELQSVIDYLKPHKDYQFIIYSDVEHVNIFNNITVKPFSSSQFDKDLQLANAVITNAGFELVARCLSLGKKLLIKPMHGQIEQQSNALALQSIDAATVIDHFDTEFLGQWLSSGNRKAIKYPNVAEAFVQWLEEGDYRNIKPLVEKLWLKTEGLPDYKVLQGKKITYNKVLGLGV